MTGVLHKWISRLCAVARTASGDLADRPRADAGMRVFEAFHDRASMGLALLGPDGSIIRTNSSFRKITGYGDSALAGVPEAQLNSPDCAAAGQAAWDALRRTGSMAPYDKTYITPSGLRVEVRVSAVVVTDAGDGMGESIWWLAEDITARRQAFDALKASEAEARMLSVVASHTGHPVLIADPQGRIEWVNRAFEKISGYTLAELQGRVPGHVLQGRDTDPATVAIMRDAIAARRPFNVEVLNYARNGRAYVCQVECTPVFDHLGRMERFVALQRDVTAERERDAVLMASELRFRDLTELSSDWFWESDSEHRLTHIAMGAGAPKPSFDPIGMRRWELPGIDTDDEFWSAHRRTLEARLPFRDCEFVQMVNGKPLWRRVSGRPLFDPQGTFTGYRGVGRDIGEQVAARQALRDSQERYARAIEGASDAIWERDLRTGVFYVSPRLSEMLHLDPSTRPTSLAAVFDSVHPDDLAAHRRHIALMLAGRETRTWESRFRTGDGAFRWLRVRGRTVCDAAGLPILTSGTASDIHDARQASEELRAMQVRYQRAMDGANDAVWECDVATDRFYFSDRFDEILGYGAGGIPRSRAGLLDLIHPEDLAGHLAVTQRMARSRDAMMWDLRLRSASGDYRWTRMRGIATHGVDGNATLTSGTASDIHAARLAEEELKRHRDNLAQLVEERTAGLLAANAEAQRQRTVAEGQRRQAEAARQAAVDANQAKSEFLANMSHELRTPMHAIISFANFGVERMGRVDGAKLVHYFQNIRKSGLRLLELLNALLDLAKLEAGKMEMHRSRTSLKGVIEDAMCEFEALARTKGIDLLLQADGVPEAEIDSMRLLQVLRNLLSNALKFTPSGGVVRIECQASAQQAGTGAAGAVLIRVHDSGIGIPEAELEAVFDKFVQSSKTKTGAGGTGLGLAICREIVGAHGGSITASNNAAGPGATFVVRLPIAEAVRAEPAEVVSA